MWSDFGPSDGSLTLAGAVERAEDAAARSGWDARTEGPRSRVHLWGTLPFSWCGNLSLHCRALGVKVVDADARHLGGSRWAASLLLEPMRSFGAASAASSHDYLLMARHRPALVPLPQSVAMDVVQLSAPTPTNPTAHLHLRAPDRAGLLAAIGEAILEHGLRPTALSVRTRSGMAEDWFALTSSAETPPDERALDALRRHFESSLSG